MLFLTKKYLLVYVGIRTPMSFFDKNEQEALLDTVLYKSKSPSVSYRTIFETFAFGKIFIISPSIHYLFTGIKSNYFRKL